ncbi:hypothetical protein FJY63_13970 [Candidatus Sumerlaeota bacterium]|nr:hypothetical protein [Candidatus Sumerlaeota bacterium]
MLALFFVPSFLYLLIRRDPATGRLCLAHTRHVHEILLVIVIVWSLLLCAAMLTLQVEGLDNNISRLVPLRFPLLPSRYRFALFSWDHAKMWLYFNWKSSPLGLAVLLLLCWTIRGRFARFLLLATACGFLWTWLWHPDRGLHDWDLFANLAVPLNVLGGLLLERYIRALKRAAHESDA